MELTGNPFVDNGLRVTAHLCRRDSVEAMSLSDIREVIGDGSELADTNAGLKSFTMVFGTNGPLTQYAYQKAGKNKQIYRGTIQRLLAAAENEGRTGEPCELTGIRTSLNFHEVCAAALRENDQKVPDLKWIGRDWVPLAGSLGNDAQALPSASRPLHVSATALLALQYLPRCLFLFQGLLACHQSTCESLIQDLVSDLVEQNRVRLHGEILGKGEGSRTFVRILLNRFQRLREHTDDRALPPETALQLWLFSNSGTGADCKVVDVPDRVLRILAKAEGLGLSAEIERMLTVEPRDPRYQFLTVLREEKDYNGLYPFAKWPGASQHFYEFYQMEVRSRPAAALRAARRVALAAPEILDKKLITKLRKPEAFSAPANRAQIRRVIADKLMPSSYDALFPTVRRSPIAVDFSGWSLIRFYLNLSDFQDYPQPEELVLRTTHPKIEFLARDYMTRKPERVKDVLDRLARRKMGVPWLRERFCELAEMHPGYTYEDWQELAVDEEGRPVVNELLFQFRLELANLYRKSKESEESVSHG